MRWSPDSLFYQAHVYELRGESQTAALHRAFSSDAARSVARRRPSVRDAAWVSYSAQFYRRRWVAPAIAAALFPISGQRSLLYASILGYVAAALLLFALLRTRFPDSVSLAVAGACLLLPPVRTWGGCPLTDSWGLALEVGSLWAALLALERGGRYIGLWVASILALSFTRDATVVLLVAVGWIAITTRTRRSTAVLASGIAAAVPAFALFGAPLIEQLSYAMQGFRIPHPASWSYVTGHYPATMLDVLHRDAVYPGELSLPYLWYMIGAAILATIVYTMFASPRRDPFFMLQRAALVGAAVTVALAANWTDMRVELVFVPCVAAALAFTSQRGLDVLRRRPPPNPPMRSDEPQIFEVSDGGATGR